MRRSPGRVVPRVPHLHQHHRPAKCLVGVIAAPGAGARATPGGAAPRAAAAAAVVAVAAAGAGDGAEAAIARGVTAHAAL